MSCNHPDFPMEKERLDLTKDVIAKYLKAIETNEKTHIEDIRQAFIDLDYLDSSQSYITILTSTQLLEAGRENQKNLEIAKDKPYFARIDFKTKRDAENRKYYIGKTSVPSAKADVPMVIDWRAPIANIYYEGRLGETTYESPTGTVRGELNLKRQFTINEGKLENIFDIDITTNDDFLQASLEAGADNKLKDIAATIQAEQNKIIRADMNKPLVVQGVAGSGKTTIALHRIAYLIYTYEDTFIPENFLIIAPNRLFINYISEVLPELGVDRVKQTTFIDFMLGVIGTNYNLINPNDKLAAFINKEHNETEPYELVKWASAFKGSMTFKVIIDAYLRELEQSFVPGQDFMLADNVILNKEEINRLFVQEYNFLPFYQRIGMIKKILSNKLKPAKEKIFKDVEESYNYKIDRLRTMDIEDEEKRKLIISLVDEKDSKLEELNRQARTLVAKYISLFPKKDLFYYYSSIIGYQDVIHKYIHNESDMNNINFLCERSKKLLGKKHIEYEDLAPLAYLKHRLYGMDEKPDTKHCVIDEAQDLSSFQIYALREVLNTDLFTIFGDLSQGIHSYRGTNNWSSLIKDVFPDRECSFKTLEQSYRTTIEIMEFANEILRKSGATGVVYAEPVIRHGDKPSIETYNDTKSLIEKAIKKLEVLKPEGHKTTAFICKTINECEVVKKLLEEASGLKVDLITGDEVQWDSEIVVLPAYIAKGLEFDVVFIICLEDIYTTDDIDIKLFYVAVTRARQKLFILQVDNKIKLLD